MSQAKNCKTISVPTEKNVSKSKTGNISPNKPMIQTELLNRNTKVKTVHKSKSLQEQKQKNSKTVKNQPSDKQGVCSVDLTSPNILSALQLASEIQAFSCEKQNLRDKPGPLHIAKGLKKANIPIDKHVYRNLVELEVNDEDLISGKGITAKKHNLNRQVDEVFNLSDYYKPDFSTQFQVEPQVHKTEQSKIEYYNGLDIYNVLESLPDVI